MSIVGTSRYLERNQFFNGQRLFASDLQAVEEFDRTMRWLHNMTLHQPGIGSGLATRGAKGDRNVVIEPGYAIDALGRELVLTEAAVQPVPPVAGDGFGGSAHYDLTISYPDEPLTATETREGVCGPVGAIRLREAPALCWIRLGPAPDRLPTDPKLRDDVQKGLRLRLARAEVLDCRLERSLSLAERRNARPPEQPYVACGQALAYVPDGAPAGTTPELTWTAPFPYAEASVGFELRTTVDTSAAGFRTVPCYTAHVIGDRLFKFAAGDRMLDGFVTLIDPQPTRFDFSLLIPDSLLNPQTTPSARIDPTKKLFQDEMLALIAQKSRGWRIEWMGVEG